MMDAKTKKRARFVILKLIYEKHDRQEHRFDDVLLTGGLARLFFDVHVNLVRRLLQDLHDQDLLIYDELKDGETGKVTIGKIQLTAKGRQLVEDNEGNPFAEV